MYKRALNITEKVGDAFGKPEMEVMLSTHMTYEQTYEYIITEFKDKANSAKIANNPSFIAGYKKGVEGTLEIIEDISNGFRRCLSERSQGNRSTF